MDESTGRRPQDYGAEEHQIVTVQHHIMQEQRRRFQIGRAHV